MRNLILQLLPKISVLCVPGVLQVENAKKPYVFERNETGTPFQVIGVPSVPDDECGTPETPAPRQGVPPKKSIKL